MAQTPNNSYLVENTNGRAVRADVNSILDAIKTANSGATAPTANLTPGQLWWDTSNGVLNVRTGTTWRTISENHVFAANTEPGTNQSRAGDLWFHTGTSVLYVYVSNSWMPIATSTVILTSPNGTRYRLTVADDGTLGTTAV